MRRPATILVVALLASALASIGRPPPAAAQSPSVVINEFLAVNENNLADNTGAFEDWIELHNTSGATVDLGGWTIADSSEIFTFPAGFTVASNGFRVVFASGDPNRTAGSELHLPFKLSGDGEPLALRDAGGTLSQPSWAAPGFPPLPVDVSYGRALGGGLAYFSTPTPGSANGSGSSGLVSAPTFSVPHGFYSSTRTVVVDTATPAATIRYTLDGSEPTPTAGTVISPGQSISVSSTSTVRAIAYRTGWIESAVETRTYLFTGDIVNQSTSTPSGWPGNGSVNSQRMHYGMDPNVVNGNEAVIASALTAIPSLSIVTDLDHLFDQSTGIYVNAWQSGAAWERPASVELIDPTGADPGFDIIAGLRIRGGGSRDEDNPKHSFRVYFRDEYGGNLEYSLFGAEGADTFESLGLPTGQHGSWQFRTPEAATWIREMWSRDTQRDMGQPYTRSRHYHLYLNGQYWGVFYSQERVSNGYGAEYYGGSEGDYDVITSEWRSAGTATDGTVDAWASLYQYVSDLTVTAGEFAMLDGLVDLENLADYYVLHYYTGDWDGSPMGWRSNGVRWADSNNWRAMRNRAGVGRAGKWIFFDHDSEFTLCQGSSSLLTDNTDWNLTQGTVPNHGVPTPAWLHQALLSHSAYRQIFMDRVALHMQPGGVLDPPVGQARLDVRSAQLTGAIAAESARWGDSLDEPPYDHGDWNSAVATLRQCIADRYAIVQSQLADDGLWPSLDAPVMVPPGQALAYGTDVQIVASEPGTLWYTTDGSDPRASSGAPAGTAVQYTGPIAIVGAVTIKARVRTSGGSWTPLAEEHYTLLLPPGPVPMALNEYNAVSSSNFLGGGGPGDVANGIDATFGRVAGNGGDWFELVVIEDRLDIRGWKLELWHLDQGLLEQSAALVFGNDPLLSDLRAGTLITVSEAIADDVSYDPQAGDWHINLQANSADQGAYFTPASQQNFAIDKDDTQIGIFDDQGLPVALRTGEGTVPGVSVSSEEVFKLEAAPTPSINFDSTDYQDGTSSTWGLPNRWANGTIEQDLSGLRIIFGDANCDATMSIADALVILQYTVSQRTPMPSCPLPDPATEIWLPGGDVDGDDGVTIADALLIVQCTAGIPNQACP